MDHAAERAKAEELNTARVQVETAAREAEEGRRRQLKAEKQAEDEAAAAAAASEQGVVENQPQEQAGEAAQVCVVTDYLICHVPCTSKPSSWDPYAHAMLPSELE